MLKILVAVLLAVMVFVLIQIKCDLSEIKISISDSRACATKEMVCGFKKGMSGIDWKAQKSKGGADWKAKKERMNNNAGEWQVTKEHVQQKLHKLKRLLVSKEFASPEEKNEYLEKYNQLKSDVEKDDADYNALCRELRELMRELK